ncbi:MAG: PKD domain-containing protein, partial [Gemmatimonadetes bacterium]|nr:PKD domain-containing protein [Gemmatimonadota bacterium]
AANGSVVKLTVSTAPGDSLRSFESVVGWDAAVLQYDSAVKRTFLSSVFTPTPQGAGQVKLVGSTKTPAAPTVETALADLYFTVIGCPPSTARTTTTGLKLFNAKFQPIALTGKPIVEDTVAVTGTTCGGGSNQAPIAAPGGPYVGTPNNLVIFDGSGSRDPDGTIASYDWQFGDGTTGAGVNPGHAYTAPGTYTATLTVRDDKGATASATVGVTILNTQPPLARANGPYTGRVGQTLSFSAAGSNDPDGAIVRFDWDFGDGRTGAGPAPQHVYERAGTYTAKLTVTDNLGATASANAQVTVDIPATFAWKNTWMLPPTPTTTAAAYAPLEGPPGSARPGDRVALKVTTRPGVPIVQAQGEIFFNPFVVRFDSVQAGARFDAFLNVTPGLPNRLQILGRSTAPLPDTLEALIATAWFTVIGLDGDSTTTQTAGVVLQNPQGQPLNLNTLPVLEGTLAVEEDTFVPGNQLPAAEANGPYTGTVGNPVTFSSAGSVDPDGSIVSYAWNFGDGAAGTGPQPSHSYTAPGTYTVILAVTDNDGARATDQATVTITSGGGGNQAPTASFTNTCTALACTFDGSASSDPDGTIASWAWNFGDGGSGTGANASHTYAGAGTYTVTLTVTDNGGATAASTKSVTVAPAGPSGNLVGVWTNTSGAVITSASVGQTVKLQICSTDSSVQAFQGVLHFGATVSQGPHGDLNSVTAGKGACVGTADVMDQYTGAQNSPAPGDNSFLSFSIAAAAGAGAQGLGAFDLTLNAAGSYTPTLTVDVYTAFGGANITPVVSIPTLTVN